ncbi:MAG: SHOCT domain-containing protein [Pikeienuella sp.]
MKISDEIAALKRQHDEGTLSAAEFEAAKAKLLADRRPPPERTAGISTALWALIFVVVIAAGAGLFLLDEINRSLQLLVGSVGVIAAAAGTVLSVTEEMSISSVLAFAIAGLAIGAVAFAALSPVLIPVALLVLAIGALKEWLGDLFTG